MTTGPSWTGLGPRTLGRNAALNLSGQVLPAAVAIATIPFLIARLGTTRFGVLSLAWVVLGYLTYLDLGLGRSTTRFVADAHGRGDLGEVRSAFWTSLVVQAAFGALAASVLWWGAPLLARGVFRVPAAIRLDTIGVVRVLAVILPFQLCSLSARGVLEALQRFGAVNVVKTIANSSLFAVPALAALGGSSLTVMIAAVAAILLLMGLVYLGLDVAYLPELRRPPAADLHLLRPLLGYGGWVATSSALVAVLVYLDRLVLSVVRSVSLLPYYAVPYDLASRLQVVPGSLVSALFPAVAAVAARDRNSAAPLVASALRGLFLVMTPLTIALVGVAGPTLQLWLGESFAHQSTVPLQIVALALLMSSFSQVFAYAIDGVGRPDLRTKAFISYLPFYGLAAVLVISKWGVLGAALALLLRCMLDLVVLGSVAIWIIKPPRSTFESGWWVRAVLLGSLFGVAAVLANFVLVAAPIVQSAVVAALMLVFAVSEWLILLGASDRRAIRSMMPRLATGAG